MANINPIFSIEYPNLNTLLFIRKQYPQLADMEIGTSIIDEECIIVHYLPAEDKACQVAEELIYFGTLLSSTKYFHRTDDQYDLVYRCVSLAHEVKESKTVEAFSSLGEKEVKVPKVTLGDLLRSHLAKSQQAEAPTVESPVAETEADVTKGDKTLGVSCVDMGHPGPYTLEEVFAEIAKQSNPQRTESPEAKTPFTGFKPDEVVPLQGAEHSKCTGKCPDKDEVLGYVGAGYDGEMDQLSITYPYDKTVFTSINVNDPEEYFENIKTISEGIRAILKTEYDFEANPRLLGIKDMIKIYIDDLSKVAERVRKVSGPFDPGIEKAIIEEVITNIVPKISTLVLKPQFIANRPD